MTLVLAILAALISLFTAGTVVLVIVQRRPRSDRRRRRRRTHLPASDEATHRHPPPIIFTVAGFPVIGLAPKRVIGTQ
jgi:hypothetical protein